MLFLESENPDKDISFYINSPGGSVAAGMAIYDTMEFIRPDVSTLCIGMAASMGAFPARGRRQGQAVRAAQLHGPDSPAVRRLPGPGVGHRAPRAIRDRPEAPVHRADGADSPDARRSRSSATTTVTISSQPTRPKSTESSTRSCRSGPRAGKVLPTRPCRRLRPVHAISHGYALD